MSTDTLRVITPLSGAIDELGFYARCELADGTEVGLVPLFGGAVGLTIGTPAEGWHGKPERQGWYGYTEEWMFEGLVLAAAAYTTYCLDPSLPVVGWRRHVARGKPVERRRICRECGRVVEYGNDKDGVAERPPACTYGDASMQAEQ